jgi:hypothetical protein
MEKNKRLAKLFAERRAAAERRAPIWFASFGLSLIMLGVSTAMWWMTRR